MVKIASVCATKEVPFAPKEETSMANKAPSIVQKTIGDIAPKLARLTDDLF